MEWEHVIAAHIRKNEDKAAKIDAKMNKIKEIEEFMLEGEDINDAMVEEVGGPLYKNIIFPF